MACLLCGDKEADKKGSHVIPHFLIESMVNVDSLVGRDKEQSCFITVSDAKFFFGRSVLPEHLEEIFGRPITDEEIEKNKEDHQYVRDNIFCTECENKLGHF